MDGDGLVDRRVEAAVPLVDQRRQRQEIGVEQLRQLAPLLDDGDERVVVADRPQDTGVGRVAGLALAPGGETELLEEDPGHLLGRAQLELLPGELEGLCLELLDALAEARGDLAHPVGVDPDPGVLHVGEHRGERELDLVVQLLRAPFPQARTELGREPSRRLRATDEGGGLLLGRRGRDELQPVLAREVVELVAGAPGIDEVRGDQRVVRRRAAEPEELRVVRRDLRAAHGRPQLVAARSRRRRPRRRSRSRRARRPSRDRPGRSPA